MKTKLFKTFFGMLTSKTSRISLGCKIHKEWTQKFERKICLNGFCYFSWTAPNLHAICNMWFHKKRENSSQIVLKEAISSLPVSHQKAPHVFKLDICTVSRWFIRVRGTDFSTQSILLLKGRVSYMYMEVPLSKWKLCHRRQCFLFDF